MISDSALAEIFTITQTVDSHGVIRYHNASGQTHRMHGPAVIYPNGSLFWYKDGLQHRDDGPAVIRPDGTCRWYLHDCEYSESEWRYWVNSDTYRISVYGQ